MNEIAMMLIHAMPVACVAWTFTHEEIFREIHNWLKGQCQPNKPFLWRKICFLFVCEYCLSHWVALVVLLVTGYQPLYEGWLGFALGLFALSWLAVLMMDIHQKLRVAIREGKAMADKTEKKN